MSELYRSYIKEYHGEDTVEFPGGFITWKPLPVNGVSGVCVTRIYVQDEDRGFRSTRVIWDCIKQVAEGEKAVAVLAPVCLRYAKAEGLLSVFFRLGFSIWRDKPVGADQMIYLIKKV